MASSPPTPSVLPNKGGLIATLAPNDVLSGRGKLVNSHPGNIRFLTHIVPEYLEEYSDSTTTRTERAHVVARLVNEVRSRSNPPGRFLTACKDNPGQYIEIGDEKAWKSECEDHLSLSCVIQVLFLDPYANHMICCLRPYFNPHPPIQMFRGGKGFARCQ